MKAKRLLFLVMAICLASGVKAQFYDGPDDIYYYVEFKDGQLKENGGVLIFNFDGQKAALLSRTSVSGVKDIIKNKTDYYEEKVETTEYKLKYVSGNTYKEIYETGYSRENYHEYNFSYDRNTLNYHHHYRVFDGISPAPPFQGLSHWEDKMIAYKKVDKSFFKVGRSRTPSGTLHE